MIPAKVAALLLTSLLSWGGGSPLHQPRPPAWANTAHCHTQTVGIVGRQHHKGGHIVHVIHLSQPGCPRVF